MEFSSFASPKMCVALEGFTVFASPIFISEQKMMILFKSDWRPTFLALVSGLFGLRKSFCALPTKPYHFWGGVKRNGLGPDGH